MATIKIRYESSVSMATLNLSENSDARRSLLAMAGTKFISVIPDHFLIDQVKDFYNTLRRDDATDILYASFTYFTNRELTHSSTVEVNVSELARACFALPSQGSSPFSISVTYTEKTTEEALVEGAVITKPLKAKVFKPCYKTLLKIIQKCFIGMLGSPDQVSQPHKQLLATLMQLGPFDWETAYLSFLLSEKKTAKTIKDVKQLRQESGITFMILKAVEGTPAYWSQIVPLDSSHCLFKGDLVPITASVPQTAGEGVPSPPESQPAKKRRTTKAKPSSGRIPIVISSRITVSSSSPIQQTRQSIPSPETSQPRNP